MIFLQVFLGILAALFVVRLIVGFRMRRMGFRHWHGHHGHHGGWAAWRIYRSLNLSRDQKDQIRELFLGLKGSARELRGNLPQELLRTLGAETFDRVTAERVADERFAMLVRLKDQALETLAKIHALLTPEQRNRLATAF